MSHTPIIDTIDAQATYRLLRARAELIMARRFYGVLVQHVEPVLSRDIPTMATDSKKHYFNPDFIAGLTQEELLAVQAHESEHDARHHSTRRGGRDPKKWNIACDYAINLDLKDQGFVLPKGALLDEKYRDMSAEDIYRAREMDEQKQQQKQAEDEQQEEDGEPQENEEGEGEASDDGDEPSDDEVQNGSDPGDEDEQDTQSQGAAGSGGESEGETANTEQGTSDPGGMGEVLDASEEASEMSDLDIEWERNVTQAASLAKGDTPDHITRELEKARNPTRNWRDELRQFCEQGALRIETWNKPNRRHAARGQIMPSMQKDGIGKAAFVIDTSGSMDLPSLQAVRDEAQGMLDDGVIEEVVVIYCDVRVTRVDHFQTGEEIEFDPRGGGGTDLKPAFQYVADEEPDASVLICFTDLMIGDPGPEPLCPVLFAVTGYPTTVQEMIAKAPWGARGIDVGAR